MSTAEVASQADSNAQSAQDVQNVLAELKADSRPETTTDSAAVEDGTVAEIGSNEESTKQPETNGSDEKNGSKESGNKNEDDLKEEKKVEAIEGDKAEPPRGHRPHRGGARGRGDFKSYKLNIKSNLMAQEETDDPAEIRKQVTLSPSP
jgi:hypothetical protein